MESEGYILALPSEACGYTHVYTDTHITTQIHTYKNRILTIRPMNTHYLLWNVYKT